eukprot:3111417-Prymnesium_polylepis.4
MGMQPCTIEKYRRAVSPLLSPVGHRQNVDSSAMSADCFGGRNRFSGSGRGRPSGIHCDMR